jgi:hypothetical protein
MGKCRYCQEKVGLFKDVHDVCLSNAESNKKLLAEIITEAINGGRTFAEIEGAIESTKSDGKLSKHDSRFTLIRAASSASQKLAVETPVNDEYFERIYGIFKGIDYDFQSQEVKENGWFGFVALLMSNTLYQVMNNKIPYYDDTGRMNFQLGRQEQRIFSTGRTIVAEYRDVTSSRSYQSVSLPVGGGLYYRVGASSTPTHQTSLIQIDEGEMLLTTQAIYFGGQESTFRIPYNTVLRFEAFTDGIGVFQNHGRGKVFIPDYSGMEVGWFFYNLATSLAKQDN